MGQRTRSDGLAGIRPPGDPGRARSRPGHAAWLAQFGNARMHDIYAVQVAELAEPDR
jgi:hypothetical protein